jgi:pyrophosphatase PpaX
MSLRGVIFDLDGTLGDTLPATLAAFRTIFLRRLGVEYSDREIRALFGPDELGVFMRLIPDAAEAATAEFLSEYERCHAGLSGPFEGIAQLLDTLAARKVACAVVTGKGAESAELSLRLLGLERYFPIVEAGSLHGAVKPAAMRRVLEHWGYEPDAVAGIGDHPSDVRAARANGMIALGAGWARGTDVQALHTELPEAVFPLVSDAHAWLTARI